MLHYWNPYRRYYIQHFKDSMRQCCLDLMLGHSLSQIEIDDYWSYISVIGNIASELVPDAPPSYIPHVALTQEFELANALYYMSRSVDCLKNPKSLKTLCYL